ncbi:hypothetical protein P4O66_011900 [Electrophorus voltai]|uniref:Uncharacterized protein n=1 Tax=Electrophorus voltai TaxID=2609070 RepID=A0AAD8Z8V9_9TELE|nr:hypothetical protein P4O66_011900 [Electrophorus voltai]
MDQTGNMTVHRLSDTRRWSILSRMQAADGRHFLGNASCATLKPDDGLHRGRVSKPLDAALLTNPLWCLQTWAGTLNDQLKFTPGLPFTYWKLNQMRTESLGYDLHSDEDARLKILKISIVACGKISAWQVREEYLTPAHFMSKEGQFPSPGGFASPGQTEHHIWRPQYGLHKTPEMQYGPPFASPRMLLPLPCLQAAKPSAASSAALCCLICPLFQLLSARPACCLDLEATISSRLQTFPGTHPVFIQRQVAYLRASTQLHQGIRVIWNGKGQSVTGTLVSAEQPKNPEVCGIVDESWPRLDSAGRLSAAGPRPQGMAQMPRREKRGPRTLDKALAAQLREKLEEEPTTSPAGCPYTAFKAAISPLKHPCGEGSDIAIKLLTDKHSTSKRNWT